MIKNSIYNLIGMSLPVIVGLFSIPALIAVLGAEKFGILTLIWAIVGYFGVFDLGLGRAMTLVVREELSKGSTHEKLNSIIWTTLLAMGFLGIIAFCIVILYTLIFDVRGEILIPLLILGVVIPFVILSNGVRGVLEAAEEFKFINLVRTPLGIYTYLAPLFAAYIFESDLIAIAIMLGLGRILLLFLYSLAAVKIISALKFIPVIDFAHLPRLLNFGGWLTVSNIVGPLMGYIDRFFIARSLGFDSVAYYVTPYEIITRLWIIPGAITGVLFPSLVSMRSNIGYSKILRQLAISLMLILIIILPISVILFFYSYELISWWINPDFANQSSAVLKILSIGIVINCISHVPYTLIHSSGNSKATAIIHLIELPILIISLVFLIGKFGILGAAYAWLIRIIIDFTLLSIVGIYSIKGQRS